MVSDQAIMGYVRVGEKVSVVADHSFCIRQSATVNRREFSEAVAIADLQKGRFADILQILAPLANGAVWKEAVVLPDFGRPRHGHMAHEHGL